MTTRRVEPLDLPEPPAPHVLTKGQNGARLIDGKPVTKQPTKRQQQIWDAVEEHGSQGAAARALGVTQGAIQSGLKGYMQRKGIEGKLPGYRPKGKPKDKPPATESASDQRVNGGPVEPQGEYKVGEKGREEFRPAKGGTVEIDLRVHPKPSTEYALGYAVATLRVVAGWESDGLPEFLQDMASDAADGLMR